MRLHRHAYDLRETRDGVRGLRCTKCAAWTPLFTEPRAGKIPVTPPACDTARAVLVPRVTPKIRRLP